MGSTFYGRDQELKMLKGLLQKDRASLVVIKGRRRIGKSRLAEEFGRSIPSLFFVGLPPAEGVTAQAERKHFAAQLEQNTGIRGVKADDWADLFWHLANQTKNQRILIVLDEINWMGLKDPTFLGKLKTAWDLYFSKNPDLIMILSGSLSGWIERNILKHTGFLGRISLDFTLDELSPAICKHFWKDENISPYEIFKILAVTGGVPRYLEEINPKISSERNLENLCFKREGYLFNEFDNIFTDLFSRRAGIYKRIVQALLDKSKTLKEITHSVDIPKGGVISEYLEDLVQIGYLEKAHTWDLQSERKSKFSRYRLKDNYIRFYLKFIEPNRDKILNRELTKPKAWDSIMGLQFETLVLNNRHSIYKALGIPLDELIRANPYFQTKTKVRSGCQVDFLIQTQYNCIYPCEIKFSKRAIGLHVVKEVDEKVQKLQLSPKKLSVRPVLIHINGVNEKVSQSSFFTKILNFEDILAAESY